MPEWWHGEDIIRYAPLLTRGLLMTLTLALGAYAVALLLGVLVAVVRFYQVPLLSPGLAGLVYGIRSIPAIMLLVLLHFGILPLLGFQNSFLLSAYLGLTLYTTAYLAEILRGGFQSIHQEEFEAAISLGMTGLQRLVYILIPLLLLRMLPTLVNQFVTLLKDTSLASIIGVIELTRAAEIVYERTLHEVTLLVFISVVYFLICYSLSRWAGKLEIRLSSQE